MQIYSILNRKDCLNIISYRNKYDTMENQISKDVFQAVINNQENYYKSYLEYGLFVRVNIEKTNSELIEVIKGHYFVKFKVSAHSEGVFKINENGEESNQLNDSTIFIDVILSSSFSQKDYNALNYNLYEYIRHELEHRESLITLNKPSDKYKQTFDKLFNDTNIKTLKEHCKLMSDYILDPQEILSYAKSIYYVAKKQVGESGNIIQQVNSVMQQIIGRSFYNNITEYAKMAQQDLEIVAIVNKTKEALLNKINELFPYYKVKTKSV